MPRFFVGIIFRKIATIGSGGSAGEPRPPQRVESMELKTRSELQFEFGTPRQTEISVSQTRGLPMKLQSKLVAGLISALAISLSPAAQASSWGGAASSASQAANSAAQSAVRNSREDAARRAMAQHRWNQELRRTHRHDHDYSR
jgi:hypothetical protein